MTETGQSTTDDTEPYSAPVLVLPRRIQWWRTRKRIVRFLRRACRRVSWWFRRRRPVKVRTLAEVREGYSTLTIPTGSNR